MSEEYTDEEELQKLMTGQVPEPTEDIDPRTAKAPDPTPEVTERARAIFERHQKGETITSVSDVPEELPLDDKVKSRFLAHVLGGVPFTQQYTAFGDRLTVTLRTLSSQDELLVSQLMLERLPKGASAELRSESYRQFALALSIESMEVDGTFVGGLLRRGGEVATLLRDYDAWMASTPGTTYRLLYTWYLRFRKQLSELLRRAEDKSFWPTP